MNQVSTSCNIFNVILKITKRFLQCFNFPKLPMNNINKQSLYLHVNTIYVLCIIVMLFIVICRHPVTYTSCKPT